MKSGLTPEQIRAQAEEIGKATYYKRVATNAALAMATWMQEQDGWQPDASVGDVKIVDTSCGGSTGFHDYHLSNGEIITCTAKEIKNKLAEMNLRGAMENNASLREKQIAVASGSDTLVVEPDAVHGWFELSYAQYLTIPRSVLQSMPDEWQTRFVKCLEQLDEMIDWRPESGRYWVKLKDANGRYKEDPLQDYQRGRRKIPLTQTPISK